MFLSRGEFEWNKTASLLATIINVNRDPKKAKAINPNDLNPFLKDTRPQKSTGTISVEDFATAVEKGQNGRIN